MPIIQFETGQKVNFEGTPTQADIDEVAEKLGIKPPKQEGFLSKTAKAILTPVATMIARPYQLGKALAGATPEEQAVNLPFLGKIETAQTYKDSLKDVGRAAETISLGIGGGGAVSTVKTGLKGLIAQGAKEGTITGLQSGALTGFGLGLQQAVDEEPSQAFKTIFGQTALGGTLGGATGGVFGAATPLVAKGVTGVKKFANVAELENKLSQGYKRILNPTARQVKVDSRFGNDSFSFLAKEAPDLPLTVNKDGRVVADDAIEMLKGKYMAEATAYKPIIRNSGKYVDIDNVIANAKKVARQEFDGSDLIKAEQQIDDEINAYLRNTPQDVNVTPSGKRFVSLDRADDIKTYSWNRGKGWGSPDAEVWNDTNNLIGHSLKDAIEKELPDAPIRAMNKRLGQYKNAIDMLERRNGQVSGSGGKLSKYLVRSVGTGIGAGLGGEEGGVGGTITGAGAGFMTANALALLLSNPNVRLFAVRQILKNLKKAGRQDMIEEAQKILQTEASKYLLPAAGKSSYIEPVSPTINLPQSVRETNLGLDVLRGAKIGYQPIAEQIAPPITAPKITAKKVSINKTIPQNKKISNVSDDLVKEAKKYATPEEFVKAQRQTKEWLKEWTWNEKGTIKPTPNDEVIKFLDNPDFKSKKAITVYRGIYDSNKTDLTKQFSSWTTDKDYAGSYGNKILRKIVNPDDVLVQVNKLPFEISQHGSNSEVILKPIKGKLPKVDRVVINEVLLNKNKLNAEYNKNQFDKLKNLDLKDIQEKIKEAEYSISQIRDNTPASIVKYRKELLSQLEQIWKKANQTVDPLIQEAKKYKSAEEFLKDTGIKPYVSGIPQGWYYKKEGVPVRLPETIGKLLDKSNYRPNGITKVTRTSNNLYHTTPKQNLESIAKEGLVVGKKPRFEGVSSPTKISFSASEKGASYYGGTNDVMIRTVRGYKPKDLQYDMLAGGEGYYTSGKTIPPEMLEVNIEGKWIPLLKAKLK